MSETKGGLPPSNFGGEEYQIKIRRLHRLIDQLFRHLGSYHAARQEAVRRYGLPAPQLNNEQGQPNTKDDNTE